jgi:hypothetical protein
VYTLIIEVSPTKLAEIKRNLAEVKSIVGAESTLVKTLQEAINDAEQFEDPDGPSGVQEETSPDHIGTLIRETASRYQPGRGKARK